MVKMEVLISILCVVVLSFTQNAMGVMTEEEKRDILSSHNKYRQLVLEGKVEGQPKALNMPNLTWDKALEEKAQFHADQCIFEHDAKEFRRIPGYRWVGQNLAFFSYDIDPLPMWFDEHHNYNFETGACKEDEMCGHYTQVVWAESVKVGCGKNYCQNLAEGKGAFLWTCNYASGGNLNNQKPYDVDSKETVVAEDENPEEKKILDKNLFTEEEKKEILESHNYYRRAHRDGQVMNFPNAEEMNLLTWDKELEVKATEYGLQCKFWRQPEPERSSKNYKKFGQNYFGCPNPNSFPTSAWYQTERFYDYAKNEVKNKHAFNFKQLVWYKAKKLGCYKGKCGAIKIVICDYDEEAEQDSRPYPETLEGNYNEQVGSKYSAGSSKILLDKMNELRKEVQKGSVVGLPKSKTMPSLEWNKELASEAQTLASKCKETYSISESEYGLTTAHTIDIGYDYFETWKGYGKNFGFQSQCEGDCLTYTQMFTAAANKIGCGYEECPALVENKHVHVCLYNKKANSMGEPYEVADPSFFDEVGSDMSLSERFLLLSQHNHYRTMAMRGEIPKQPKAAKMPLLKWNDELAKAAQKDLESCEYKRYPDDASLPGIGNYVHVYQFFRDTAVQAVRSWFKLNWSYQYGPNTGTSTVNNYKILVNSKVTMIGCAVKNCPQTWNGVKFIKCNYAELTSSDLQNNRPYEEA